MPTNTSDVGNGELEIGNWKFFLACCHSGLVFLDSMRPKEIYNFVWGVLPITNYPLPITHYPLPITYYLLPITNNKLMDELKYLATWVKEQHAQEYILTWLLNQPGLWWSDGEAYQAAAQKSGKLLREYVKNNQQGDLFQGIADKIVDDESWDQVALSLGRIIATYQEELVRLQDYSRRRETVKKRLNNQNQPGRSRDAFEIQQALPDPYADAITGKG